MWQRVQIESKKPLAFRRCGKLTVGGTGMLHLLCAELTAIEAIYLRFESVSVQF